MVTFGSLDADGNYHGEWKLYLTALYKRGERIVATPDQFDAWYAWRAVVRGLGATARGAVAAKSGPICPRWAPPPPLA